MVITGSEGFIGRNLAFRLGEAGFAEVAGITRKSTSADLRDAVDGADVIFHLAGANRPLDEREFATSNAGFTATLCGVLDSVGSQAAIVLASSIQASVDSPYGLSKRAAERTVLEHGARGGRPAHVFRLPNVFGKWARPNYNSVVATFCSKIARGEEITIHDPAASLRLCHVDDVIDAFIRILAVPDSPAGFCEVHPIYEATVGYLAQTLRGFAESRATLRTPGVGSGLLRALHATYLSYLSPASFAYDVPCHRDQRGTFVEMLKTPDCGQFSYFTAHPGVTRGEHYHHSKTEKFLVLQGTARFGFRHIVTDERHELVTKGGDGRIVETVPGWTHNVANVGDDELIVMLWANEVFDPVKPDTFALKVVP